MASFGGNYGGAQGGSGPGGRGPNGKGSASTGGTKEGGDAAVADHMIATGHSSAPSLPGGGAAKGTFNTRDDPYQNFSTAVGDYATRGILGRVADFIAGPLYDQNEPMA